MGEAISKSGRVRPSEAQMRRRLEQAGFVDIQSFTFKQPIGPWAKDKYVFRSSLGKNNTLTSIGVSKIWALCLFWRANKASTHTVPMRMNAGRKVVADC
jgi:hypothetical protein